MTTLKSIQIEGLAKPVSSLVMGSDYFTPVHQEVATEMIENYLKIGGNTIDTAFIYSGGLSEEAIGNWLDAGNRERVNIWTKGGHPNESGHTINKSDLQEQLNTSLDRLKTEHVELYALHRDDPTVPVGRILEWLNQFVEDGYISTFGGSNWGTSRLEEANEYAAKHGLRGFSFSSPNLSLAKAKEAYWPGCISLDVDAINWHQRTEIPVLSWSSQARGFFTGRFDRQDRSNEDLVRVFYNDQNWERFDRATALARQKNVTTIEIALAYVLNQAFPTAAIIGPQNNEEMLSCAKGASVSLTPDEVNWLNLDSAKHLL
ncbi:aldo/keto reductase [Shouchella sp. 1P09AA]|uniref:aldo/keto reductase n=1 Tax=unclassified Shouchella TaxID=2893065 RepID=UPI0039A0F21B